MSVFKYDPLTTDRFLAKTRADRFGEVPASRCNHTFFAPNDFSADSVIAAALLVNRAGLQMSDDWENGVLRRIHENTCT
jgi:tellurite resistance protein